MEGNMSPGSSYGCPPDRPYIDFDYYDPSSFSCVADPTVRF